MNLATTPKQDIDPQRGDFLGYPLGTAGSLAANSPPPLGDMTAGIPVFGFHDVTVQVQSTIGTNASFRVWQASEQTGLWDVNLDVGTVIVVTATDGGVQTIKIPNCRADRVYIETLAFVGAGERLDAAVWGNTDK